MTTQLNGPLYELFKTGRRTQYKKGETIVRIDDEQQYMYLIESGFVKIYAYNKQGDEYVHIIYGTGEIFPVVWVSGVARRNAPCAAVSDATLLRLSTASVLPDLEQNPIGYDFLQRVVGQFNIYASQVTNLQYKFARDRVIYRLLFLANRFGDRRANHIHLAASFTQKSIGDSINVSRESVGRELERLERLSMISRVGRQIVITDIGRLSASLDDPISSNYQGLRAADAEDGSSNVKNITLQS